MLFLTLSSSPQLVLLLANLLTHKNTNQIVPIHISPISSIKYTNHNINLYGNFTVTPFYHVGPEFVHGNSHFVFCRFKVKPFQTKCLYEHIPVNDWCVIILSGEQISMSQFIDSECWMTLATCGKYVRQQ